MAAVSKRAYWVAVLAICTLSLALCCGLAWWQWERFSSANGTFQNLGYVLQWPLFGLFPAFMFWRMRRLRLQSESAELERANDSQIQARDHGPELSQSERGSAVESVEQPFKGSAAARRSLDPADTEDTENPEDAELADYNRYLAQLNAQDR